MTIFNVLWFFLIFVLILGYFVLDGFDLGAGVLSPFIAKDDPQEMIVISRPTRMTTPMNVLEKLMVNHA